MIKIRVNPCNPWTLLLLFFLTITAYSQTGASLEAEIQNLERSIARQGAPAAERRADIVRLANLRQLSGDIEGAARAWLDAAGAIPGSVDDDALLNCAYCLAAMGEWDRSRAALEPLLAKSARARFLNASITAITSKNTNALAALADNPEYSAMKNEIYFLLWKLSGGAEAERWKRRLSEEYPQSPEASIASMGGAMSAGQTIALRLSPFWLFIGGLDSLALLPGETEGRPGTTAAPARPPAQPAPAPTQPAPTQPAPAPSLVRLQTGIYSQQANAQNQAQRLRQAGFAPTIEERVIGENKMWAVTVPAEEEQKLKSAGIEYFPLR